MKRRSQTKCSNEKKARTNDLVVDDDDDEQQGVLDFGAPSLHVIDDDDDDDDDEDLLIEEEEQLKKDKGKAVVVDVSDASEWSAPTESQDHDSSASSDDCVEFTNKRNWKNNKTNNNKDAFGREGQQNNNNAVDSIDISIQVTSQQVPLPHTRDKTPKKRGRKGENRPPLSWEKMEDENDKWIDQHESQNIDWDCADEMKTETADPSPDLILPLLRYQKEWLAWALKQEESLTRGGILADEMGMGKTIQAIALVLTKRALMPDLSPPPPLGQPSEINCTLVICPVVAVLQWANEIARYTAQGSTRVLVYHGANRKKSITQFSDYDFVLTTYSIVEAEYRKNVMPPKEKCVFCGKSFLPKKMSVHLRYFCGPHAMKTAKQSKQVRKKGGQSPTKSEHNSQGSEEAKNKKPNPEIKRAKRKNKAGGVKTGDVGVSSSKGEGVQTGEVGVSSSKEAGETNEDSSCLKKSILHSVRWNRIILDEAHFIKDRRSNTARAVLALESSYKWALSGTPLQNRVGELYSLVRFLQITPYSYYFCRDCDCKSLDYSVTTQCSNCPHKSVRHFCWWNKYIATPIQTSSSSYEGRRAMILLKHKLLKSIVLRRTKKGRASDLALPPRIVTMRRDTLDVKEIDYYESVYNDSQLQFNTYIEAGTLMSNYAHIFDLLTRLRQAVDHPYLVIYSKGGGSKSQSNNYNGEQECGICHDPAEDLVVTSCEHAFCKACLTDYASSYGQVSCPLCSKPLTADFTTKMNPEAQGTKTTLKGYRCASILNRISLSEFQTSTKIDALREEIRFMVERDGSAKGIVFSQFTSFLDLIHYSLQKSGIQCVQLVGSMTMAARDAAIKRFTDDPDCRIFLMSLKAGGVALNLTVASHVFLMDPWWNPAVERQAQDRIHRIGQYKPIRITRFIIENTIEERILKLQAKKELVFEGTVGGSSEALIKLTEADLKFLFST